MLDTSEKFALCVALQPVFNGQYTSSNIPKYCLPPARAANKPGFLKDQRPPEWR